jgi:hypothetical protein
MERSLDFLIRRGLDEIQFTCAHPDSTRQGSEKEPRSEKEGSEKEGSEKGPSLIFIQ